MGYGLFETLLTYNETMEELVIANPWTQMVDEPDEWYDKFTTYYLAMGYGRTLTKAFEQYVLAEHPEKKDVVLVRGTHTAPSSWSVMSNRYNWRKRAQAWDAERAKDLASTVTEARTLLQETTVEAVMTLRKALTNPRTAVAAAKEILDRGGVPAVTVHQVKLVPFTADDLAEARSEIEEWMSQRAPKKLLK